MMLLAIACYTFALWLGIYLLRRNPQNPALRYSGLGLLAYAVGLLLAAWATPIPELARWQAAAAVIPTICWIAAVRELYRSAEPRPRLPLRLVITATIFFALGWTLLLLPQVILTQQITLILIGGDLLLLGFGIAVWDAYNEGAALKVDMLRSFLVTLLAVVICGGQVVLAMSIEGTSNALYLLLTGVNTSVVLLLFFAPLLQTRIEAQVLPTARQTELQELQAVSTALMQVNEALDPLHIEEREFVRLTRRALAYLGDLERLAASPLLRLPLITERLSYHQHPDTTLNRAHELKRLLVEAILRLKPTHDDSPISEARRYYNALYYPYVLGIKPYSLRANGHAEDAETRQVLAWLREQVPERTLYNWQNKAAELIAQELRETL